VGPLEALAGRALAAAEHPIARARKRFVSSLMGQVSRGPRDRRSAPSRVAAGSLEAPYFLSPG
jgi:hypothetical protein